MMQAFLLSLPFIVLKTSQAHTFFCIRHHFLIDSQYHGSYYVQLPAFLNPHPPIPVVIGCMFDLNPCPQCGPYCGLIPSPKATLGEMIFVFSLYARQIVRWGKKVSYGSSSVPVGETKLYVVPMLAFEMTSETFYLFSVLARNHDISS